LTSEQSNTPTSAPGDVFATTHWTVVLAAGHRSTPESDRALGMEQTAVRVAVHRLRKRYHQLLRAEIANTLADPAQVEVELRALFSAFVG
jgi:RNA polymerase sigma-70 factor (ECF subfamily)